MNSAIMECWNNGILSFRAKAKNLPSCTTGVDFSSSVIEEARTPRNDKSSSFLTASEEDSL